MYASVLAAHWTLQRRDFSTKISFHICAAHAVPTGLSAGPLSVSHRYTYSVAYVHCVVVLRPIERCRVCTCVSSSASFHASALTSSFPLSCAVRARDIRGECLRELAHAQGLNMHVLCTMAHTLFSHFHQGLRTWARAACAWNRIRETRLEGWGVWGWHAFSRLWSVYSFSLVYIFFKFNYLENMWCSWNHDTFLLLYKCKLLFTYVPFGAWVSQISWGCF